MDFQIVPIIFPLCNWKDFVQVSNKHLGKSLSRNIDTYKLDPKRYPAFVTSMGEFAGTINTNPTDYIKDAELALSHLHATFLIIAEVEFFTKFQRYGSFKVFPSFKDDAVLLTASFTDWKIAVINGCRTISDSSVREVCTELLSIFDRAGLSDIWRGYSRTTVYDGIVLTKK